MIRLLSISFLFCCLHSSAQEKNVSKVWVADNGDGTYKNPILHADYSDPDAIRVGDDYYMTASSFDQVPGLPILHSKDLVNWSIIGYGLRRLSPYEHFSSPQHGNGVWAPSIRYHNKEFYIYYPDPDFGIYLIKAKNITGPWSDPIMVEEGKGLIDPCPLWDDDGKVYLVHAFAGSRAGIKSIIVVKEMNAEGTKTIDNGVLVYDGHQSDPTIEGPKFYKRNGYYYIFAPAGGVSTGWQLALRSRNVYGPYDRKVVMDQGKSSINGPHQGAWVTTQSGEDWFIHFQDRDAYGRVVHLQPMHWENDWPVIGVNATNGKGEPVLTYKKPNVGKTYPIETPVELDEFNSTTMGFQWQWQANPKATWSFLTGSALRLYSQQIPDSAKNLWDVPNILLQKFPAEEFTVTIKCRFNPRLDGEKFSFIVMGMDYAGFSIVKKPTGAFLMYETGNSSKEVKLATLFPDIKKELMDLYLRIKVIPSAQCSFSTSFDNQSFNDLTETFVAKPGKWIGAKFGFSCTRTEKTNDSGYADIDWIRIEK